MFCPKCGTQNPEEGKFCRSCGTDLGNVSRALTAPEPKQLFDRKGKPVHLEGAMKKLFTGFAFLVISIFLAVSKIGSDWWFWMLIPAFGMIGSGLAQYLQLRGGNNGRSSISPVSSEPALRGSSNSTLPPPQTEWVGAESRFKTGDLVPPSVTDNTTRHLEMDSEGKTMALPKDRND
jgi:zinc-ribbon domain